MSEEGEALVWVKLKIACGKHGSLQYSILNAQDTQNKELVLKSALA